MVTTFHIAYLNVLHGDDIAAALSDPLKPWKTHQALQAAVRAYQFDASGQPIPDALPVTCIDQGTCDPATFIPPFSQH